MLVGPAAQNHLIHMSRSLVLDRHSRPILRSAQAAQCHFPASRLGPNRFAKSSYKMKFADNLDVVIAMAAKMEWVAAQKTLRRHGGQQYAIRIEVIQMITIPAHRQKKRR